MARQAALFVAAAVLFGDLLITTLDAEAGRLVAGRGPILDVWDAAKAAAVSSGMLFVAWRARSVGFGVFGVVFGLIGLVDQTAWHGPAASFLADNANLEGLRHIVAASEIAWSEFLILTVFAAGGAWFIWTVPDQGRAFRSARRVLTLLLIALFGFAVVLDLAAASAADGALLAFFEEAGERLVLSLIAGYVAGVVVMIGATPHGRR